MKQPFEDLETSYPVMFPLLHLCQAKLELMVSRNDLGLQFYSNKDELCLLVPEFPGNGLCSYSSVANTTKMVTTGAHVH